MLEKVKDLGDGTFEMVLADEDLAVFYRIFAQPPKEAMRIAKIFEEEPMQFAAMCSDLREQILSQVDEAELEALVEKIRKESLGES